MKISELLRTLRFIGWENPYRALLYSFLRDIQDGGFGGKRAGDLPVSKRPGQINSTIATPHGAEFIFDNAELEILFLADRVVRVSWQPGEPPVPYAITDHFWPGAKTALMEEESGWRLNAGEVILQVTSAGELTWSLGDRVAHQDQAPLHCDGGWTLSSKLPDPSAVFGLGGRSNGLNLRAGHYRLWNRDPGGSYGREDDPLYLNVPTILVVQEGLSCLIFHENSYRGEIAIDDELNVHFDAGMLRYYLFLGKPEVVLQRYMDLTGKPEMPPRWALGFHQSRWGYRNEGDIQEVLQGFQVHELPLSAIHLDIDYMDGYRVFTIDPHRFPDLKDLSNRADEQGVKFVSIIDPGVKVDRGFRLYREGIQTDVFCKQPNKGPVRAPVWPGWVVFPDFTNPAARHWWSSQYPRLLNQGISGVWHDMNEPATFATWGDPSLPRSTEHTLEGKGGSHKQAHNLYGLLMNRAGIEGLKELRPDARPFILSRSGWAGNQRYAWNWTGDVESTWEGMRVSLNLMLGMSLSGIYYTGSDIGGFSGDPSPELLLRWMQMAVFTPFFRVHSSLTSPRREPWKFEAPYREAIRKALKLRYRLMPYLYTLAWKSSHYGAPIIRPIFWDSPYKPEYWDIEDQFFLGPDMLIAPVLDEGMRERDVLLPEGLWYSFWDRSTFNGPARISFETTLDSIPVFVRANTVLPLEGELLELHVYTGSDLESEHQLYLDSGDGYGPHRVDTFRLTQSKDNIEIKWSEQGDFPFPDRQIEIYLYGKDVHIVTIDDKELNVESLPMRINRFRNIRFKL
jgi:alpha-glucosidase